MKIFSYDVLKSKCTFKCNFCIAKICTLFNEFLNRLIAPNKSGYCSNILDLNCWRKTGTRIRRLAKTHTSFFLHVSFSSLPKSNHRPEKCSQDCPAEDGHRVDPNHPTDKGVFAASQESYNVWAHMICVFLTEILGKEKKEGRKEENKQHLQDTLGKI